MNPEDDNNDPESLYTICSPPPPRQRVRRSYSCNNAHGSSLMGGSPSSEPQRLVRRSISSNGGSSPFGGRPPLSSPASFSAGQRSPSRPIPRNDSVTSQSSTKSATADLPLVEVSEGTFVPLRGSAETHEAILSQHATISIDCTNCSMPLICVADVDCIMCPSCRSVSNNERKKSGRNRRRSGSIGRGGGLALGVREEEIFSERM